MKRLLPLLASFVLLAACTSASSSSTVSDGDAATAPPPPNDVDAASPVNDASTKPETSVAAEGLPFTLQGGGARRAWSTSNTQKPADVVDIVLTNWESACKSGVPDKSRVVALYARAVDKPGTYPIQDGVVLGGDGTSGQFSMLEWTMLDRSTWPDDVRPECGYDAMPGTRWTSGTVTITKLDDTTVEGSLEATDASGKKVTATFRVPMCLSRSPKTIGCGT